MNNISNFISDSLEYYDKNMEKYTEFLKKVKYIQFVESQYDNGKTYNIEFFDDKGIIHQSRYEVLGIYDIKSSIWIWGWAVPYLDKKLTYISRKILNYGTELDVDNEFLKTELITSRFKISNDIQIDIHSAISMYLSKQNFIANMSLEKMSEETNKYVFIPHGTATGKLYYLFILDLPDN